MQMKVLFGSVLDMQTITNLQLTSVSFQNFNLNTKNYHKNN